MVELNINLEEEQVERIKKCVGKGRFKDIDEFIAHAIKLLLYAEENKDQFQKVLRGE